MASVHLGFYSITTNTKDISYFVQSKMAKVSADEYFLSIGRDKMESKHAFDKHVELQFLIIFSFMVWLLLLLYLQ